MIVWFVVLLASVGLSKNIRGVSMRLYDENAEYAFSGKFFTNIGEDDSLLYEFSNLTTEFKGVSIEEDSYGISIVIVLAISNGRSTDMWLCYSLLCNDSEEFIDDYLLLEPNQEQEIALRIETFDIAYTISHRAQIHILLEDGRRILGRCNSICVDYNIFSGGFRYKKLTNFSKGHRKEGRELDIRVNKMIPREFYSSKYVYTLNTIPIVITNCTNRRRAFVFERIEFNERIPEGVIGLNSLSDAIIIDEFETHELYIVLPLYDFEPYHGWHCRKISASVSIYVALREFEKWQ